MFSDESFQKIQCGSMVWQKLLDTLQERIFILLFVTVQELLMMESIWFRNIVLKTPNIISSIGIQKDIHTNISSMKTMLNIF